MLNGSMLELLAALDRYAQVTGFSRATSAAHLLGIVLEYADNPDIAFTEAAAQLTEHTYWLGHPDDILDHWGMPPPPE
jgi:hypothetical protein